MLLELELPRVLAPDLSSNCYSVGDLNRPHFNYRAFKGPVLLCPFTSSGCPHGERCAPAAFLRSSSDL